MRVSRGALSYVRHDGRIVGYIVTRHVARGVLGRWLLGEAEYIGHTLKGCEVSCTNDVTQCRRDVIELAHAAASR